MLTTLPMSMPKPVNPANWTQQRDEQAEAASAFAALVEGHANMLYRIALAVTRNPQDAEDAVQETFLQIYRTRNLDQISDPRAYLARTAWRMAIRRKRPQAEELSQNLPDLQPSPEATAIEDQALARLHRQIDALPEKLRQPMALTALGDLSAVEVAQILGLPQGTVRRRLHTARELLRQRWTVGHDRDSNSQAGGSR